MPKLLDFFQNNKKNLATFVYGVIVLISMICVFTLFALTRSISNQNSLSIEVLEIKRISDELDSLLTEGFSVVAQDVFNQKRNEIKKILVDIENNEKYTDFFSSQKAWNSFTELKDAINAKRATLDEYLTQKAVITENLLDASSNLSRVEEINLFTDFYTRLLLSRFGDIFDSEAFGDELRVARSRLATESRGKEVEQDLNGTKVKKGVIDYAFLQSLINLNDNFQRGSETIERMSQLNIGQKVDNFRAEISEYLRFRSRLLDIILAVLGLCLIAYVGRLIYQRSKIIDLEIYAKQFAHIIENTNINIIELDRNGIITSVNNIENPKASGLIGKKFDLQDKDQKTIDIIKDITGKTSVNYDFTSRVSEEQNETRFVQNDVAEEIMEKYGIDEKEEERSKNLIYEKIYALPKLDIYGQLEGVNIVSQDFSGEYIANFRLNLLADSLEKTYRRDRETSLPNHIALISDLKKYPTAYLIYISIDQFQNVRFFNNSRVAHLILVEIGRVLYLCLKNSHAKAQLYHLQDDQFCVIFQSENNQDAEKLTKQLINYFSNNISIKDEYQQTINLDIKLRIGISTPRDLENTDRLVQAKLAHQKAKQLDRQTFTYEQNGEIEISYRQNQVVSRMLRRALDTNKIITECQPIYNLTEPLGENKYSLFSYEVLVRLLDEDGKIHYPGEFLNVAKNAGLYITLTKSIISIGFELVERFDYRFSMNLACSDMSNDSVRELFLKKLDACSAPDRVTVEVLESEDVEQNMTAVLEFIKEVRKKGCHVAIDDFGSGYANISMILQLNIDYIKIDGSIVQRLTSDEHAREFVRMLAGFTKSANYTMVAEFVSSQEILEVVKSLGVQYAQGFLLGRPTRLM